MSDCSNHKKEVAGISDMKVLAEMIGDLHYESLQMLLRALSIKLYVDAQKDKLSGREQLGYTLDHAALNVRMSSEYISDAWKISKPFMDNPSSKP